jgi:hypothetical protein
LSDGWKTAIGEYYAVTGNWPALANLTGTCCSIGKYESSVTVLPGGVIEIVYGQNASAKINGNKLDIVAYTNSNNDVLWRCGLGATPSGTVATSTQNTNVPAQYLPTSCHS